MLRGICYSITWTSSGDRPVRSGSWAEPGRAVPPVLSVVTSFVGGRHRVSAAGELDLVTVPLLDAAMDDTAALRIGSVGLLLDLTRVTFLDVAGLAALQRADRVVRRRGLELTVAPPEARGPGRLLRAAVGMGMVGPAFGRADGTGRGR